MHTGRRDQLHLSKVKEFADWAVSRGYKRVPTKGQWEVLRLKLDDNPVLIYWEHIGGKHATTDKRSQRLVDLWFRSRKA